MAVDTFRKRACVVGVGLPINPGVQSETIPDAFYRYSIGHSYLSLTAPPGGTGGDSDQTTLGGLYPRADVHTVLGST
jgi:hypothetical protein